MLITITLTVITTIVLHFIFYTIHSNYIPTPRSNSICRVLQFSGMIRNLVAWSDSHTGILPAFRLCREDDGTGSPLAGLRKSWPRAKKRKGKRRSWWDSLRFQWLTQLPKAKICWEPARGILLHCKNAESSSMAIYFSGWLIIGKFHRLRFIFNVFCRKPWISLLNENQVWAF